MRIILLALLLTSCASVKKFEKRYDSTGTTKVDSVRLTFYDSVTKIIEDYREGADIYKEHYDL